MLRQLRRLAIAIAVAALIALGAAAPATSADGYPTAATGTSTPRAIRPTVVLVHGAFADSSGWTLTAAALQADGYPVIAFSNPLRGTTYDSQYLRDFLTTIGGPIVLVGHSYGGAVITNAATGNPNIKSLVYIAAYALAEGESVADANTLGGGHTEVTKHLVTRPFPGAAANDADAYIDPDYFPQLFAQDLPKPIAKGMAAMQRPGAYASLVTPSGPPAWKEVPSWYLVATRDRIIPPQAERAMARRARAKTIEIKSSHVPMLSHPQIVISLIKAAAK